MKKLTRLTFLMLLLLTLKTNVSLGKNTSQIIMPINDDLPYIDVKIWTTLSLPQNIPHKNS